MMNRYFKLFLFFVVGMICITLSCSKDDDDNKEDPINPPVPVNPPDDEDDVIDLMPKAVPIELTEAEQSYVGSSNDFSFNLFRKTNNEEKSRVMSPLSVAYVLGMLNDGAEGETRKQILDVMGLSGVNTEAVNKYFANIIENAPKVDPSVILTIANAMYVNPYYTLKTSYKQDLENYYKAEISSLDFGSPEATGIINDWCNRKTEGMIPKIIDETDATMVACLLNAIYFKATWTEKFDTKDTKTEDFVKQNGGTIQMPMMHRKAEALYAHNDFYSTLCLPYSSGAFNMLVLLPNEGKTIDDVSKQLTDKGWQGMLNDMRRYKVDIKMPRFTTAYDMDLTKILISMGMVRAFTNDAEFPNVTEGSNLYVSEMKQSAKIEVNEEGTKAAAVTIAVYKDTSVGSEPLTADFHANRPFLYAIQENTSGLIFFIGAYTGIS